ncbi:MAG TPA: sigma-70 family RNA polymerase sigma factor [Humisphaera sp.]|jgi:RNA polymerase sigma-70 factor (ECF subfamily)|nr:sigma-70 family RNA polymerase sigma factor [Humisphaera sp.]
MNNSADIQTANTMLPGGPGSSESELVRRLRQGDERAYEMLVREHGARMLAVAKRLLPCPQDSADAVQEAFVSAFQSIHSFAGNSSLSTWLHRVTVNACLMMIRSRSRKSAMSIEEMLPQFDQSGHHARPVSRWDEGFARLESEETRAQVRACIDRIPEPYRTVLMLRDIEELNTEETAGIIGTTTGNVKTRLHRARQLLREQMEAARRQPN